MAAIRGFGRYLPARALGNAELAALLGCDADWILRMSGIEERRVADTETVADMGALAARECLARADARPGLLLVASGSGEARFPGPASAIGQRLGFGGVPAIDLPMASAGSLFALSLAARLADSYGDVLVVASEKMAAAAQAEPLDRNVAILFGDGAAACLVSRDGPGLAIVDSVLHSDGAWSADLRLELSGPVRMNGVQIAMQATRKIPAVIREVLERNGVAAKDVTAFLLHQANQNLIDRVALALEAPAERFYSNIRQYGNTSSASMLIAASEWHEHAALAEGDTVCFAAFGAGLHWGALVARVAT